MRKVFSGQLNVDSHPKFLPEGDYTGAKNIFINTSKGGNSGLVRKYPGFDRIGEIQEQITVGTVEDKANSKVYYFNRDVVDQIWVYDLISDEKSLLLEYDFKFGDWVNGGVIANLLYFTDNKNEIRAIDTNRTYTSIIEQDITLIKPAPSFSLIATEVKEPIDFSNLSGKGYYFSYRYIYLNNQTSVIAPYSKAVYCPKESPYITSIDLIKDTREITPFYVQKVEILARSNEELTWRVFRSVTKESFGSDTYSFNGLKGRGISDRESGKPFENIPQRAKSLTVAQDRVFVAHNTEGYDQYEVPNLKVTSSTEDVTPDPEFLQVWKWKGDISSQAGTEGFPLLFRTVTYKYYVKRGLYYYFLTNGDMTEYINGVVSGSIPSNYTGNETDLNIDASDFLTIEDLFFIDYTDEENYDRGEIYPAVPEHFLLLTLNYIFSVGERKFKVRSQYQIGIVFYDRYSRNQGVYTNQNCIKTITDNFRNSEIQYLRWELGESDPIPEWAETFQIVRTDNLSVINFLQGRTSDAYWVYKESSVEKYSRLYLPEAEFIEIDISGSIKSGLRYNFTDGDLIDIETPEGILTFNILSAVGSKVRIEAINNVYFQGGMEPYPKRLYYQIYRRRTEQPSAIVNGQEVSGNIFYEVSEEFKILNPFTPDRAFEITSGFLDGDVTVIETETYDYPDDREVVSGEFSSNELDPEPITIAIEATNIDNSEWIKDLGRPNIVLGIGEVEKKNFIRFSNKFIQGTNINGTSSFDYGDESQVPIENGPISIIKQISKASGEGEILLAVCEQEALSIYVNERIIFDNTGLEVLGQSSDVIGTINSLKGGYGTKHPWTFQTHRGRAWWWDQNSKKVARYDANGVRPISDIGNKSFFFTQNNPLTCYDPWHDMLFVGFTNNSLGFNEESNQWRGSYEFVPESSAIIDEYMITFNQGTPYKSNGNNFAYYQASYDAQINFPAVYPSKTILNNISLYMPETTYEWEFSKQKIREDLFFTITNAEGQMTTLEKEDFDVFESVAYAHIMRDQNSEGGLLNGYEIRSDIHNFMVVFKTGIEYININETLSLGQK